MSPPRLSGQWMTARESSICRWGGANTSATLQNAIDYAIAQNVFVIAAAGNTGGRVLYPAAYAPVVAVASVDSDLQMSSFSSRGAEIDLLAPGRNILTTTNGSRYTTVSGTSFAAPQVSGIAALEIALGDTLTINGGIVNINGSFIQQPTPVLTEQPPDEVVNPAKKVSHDLAALLTEYQAFQAQAQGADVAFAATNIFMPLRNDLVVIDATASGDPNLLLADLQALGLQKGAVAGYLVSGLLPINSISLLPTLDSLQFVNPAYSMTNGGAVTNQGDRAAQADIARTTYGLTGSGIRIGILSNSFDCEAAATAGDIASGDLPADIIILDDAPCSNAGLGITQLDSAGALDTASGRPASISPGDDEGRGIGQVLHDVAPGAPLAFHPADGGQANFAQDIFDLEAAGVQVLTDDVIFLAEPMFQDGVIAQAVDTVVADGIPYFSSAGNDARQSYQNVCVSTEICWQGEIFGEAGSRYDFDPGAGVDNLQSVTLPIGESVQIVLQWDQPFYSVSGLPGSASDLGLYLYTASGTLVASADDPNVGNDPVEILEYINDGSHGASFQLAIELRDGPAPTRIKYVYFNAQMTIDEFATNSSTIYGHPNAAGAEAVGAAFFYDTPRYDMTPPILEDFSSWGGTPILFDTSGNRLASPITRQKPEIVAPDGGNTTFFGSPDIPSDYDDPDTYPNFFGTSASAPLAAAVAALMLEHDPALTPAEIYSYMETTALDMGTLGFDDASGYGLIDTTAIMAALPAPFCTTVADISQEECEALEALYLSTTGESWTNNTHWRIDTTVNNWNGVAVSGGHVTGLDLEANNLNGPLPADLGNLTYLNHLNLAQNSITGAIPASLDAVTNLTFVSLADNQMSGAVPWSVFDADNLTFLNLAENAFTGSLSGHFGELLYLEDLNLGDNQFTGPIPVAWCNNRSLLRLTLAFNNLTGGIPTCLKDMTQLERLSLQGNPLSGTIPPGLGDITNLIELNLADANLTGNIPAELGSLANLEVLNLSFNRLSGAVPSQLGSLDSLLELNLSNNQLTGVIPAELGNLSGLTTLGLEYNALVGEVPARITALTALTDTDLSYNGLFATGATETFLNGKDPDWTQTQTIAPTNIYIQTATTNSITLAWTPIAYTGNGGYYEVSYSTSAGTPSVVAGKTTNKSATSYTVTGLPSGMVYNFRIRTYTPAHGDQQNNLWSSYSAVVTGMTGSPANAAPRRNYYTAAPTLSWGSVNWATGYVLQVFTNAQFMGVPVLNQAVGANVFSFTPDLQDGTYFWRVCAKKANDTCGGWSMGDSFVLDLP
ncbi:MAG TPA: S8 family serine peptidase [Phototrophicaceae bacterium]|nr:S8 family serine peptidase [Phototrophicaceae bacterium]